MAHESSTTGLRMFYCQQLELYDYRVQMRESNCGVALIQVSREKGKKKLTETKHQTCCTQMQVHAHILSIHMRVSMNICRKSA